MIRDPIFIVGTERSGSNLLRLVLDAHPRIAVSHPPHVVRYFAPIEGCYGDLRDDAAWTRLVDDVLALVATHIYPWEVPIDRARVLAEAPSRDALGATCALYEQHREHAGKSRWACKSTFMVEHVDRAAALAPGARFLFLIRDPRDVAASSKDSVFSTFHPYYTARLWSSQQRAGLAAETRHPRRFLRVRYEELATRPEETIRGVCAFLDEAFDPAMLRHSETREARRSGSLAASWSRTARPISAESVGSGAARLTPREVELVEAVAGEEMRRLGYLGPGEGPPLDAARLRGWEPVTVPVAERALRLRVEALSLRRDRNAARRWARDALVAGIRLRRCGIRALWDAPRACRDPRDAP